MSPEPRKDIPSMTIEANFKMLDQAVSDSNSFASLFGIANISDYSALALRYPFTATEMTKLLGGKGSHLAVSLLKKIKNQKGIDVKHSDNNYHRTVMVNKTGFHKYSHEMLELLKKVQAGEDYDLNME